jgi:SRSO17 transposase
MENVAQSSEARFVAYVECLTQAVGHADRARPLKDYCTGLLMPGDRKSVEPMAAVVAPARVAAEHQSLLHFIGQAPWSDDVVLDKVRELVLPSVEASGPIEAWIVDDTGFAKKGTHSVGVARQYCGRLGKTDNCQIAVTLSFANHEASLPVAYRLYLPETWTGDAARLDKAGVPTSIFFQAKTEIALDQIAAALASGAPKGVVPADAAYGTNGAFRDRLTDMRLIYAVGVQSNTCVWEIGVEALPPVTWSGRGRKPTRARRDEWHKPVSVKALAVGLPASAWSEVTWREGSNAQLASRFAAARVRPAIKGIHDDGRAPEEWLLIEWPSDETEPTKYFLSTMPEDTPLTTLVDMTKLRWRIERDYEELKSELGLAHFEGRGWRGFHHHATLCIAAYGFLIRERAAFSPCGSIWREKPRLSESPRRRGSPNPTGAPRRKLDRDSSEKAGGRSGENALPLSMLPARHAHKRISSSLVTQ